MDGIMTRQQALNLHIPPQVAVVGCGGVGSWTAYMLALAGVKKLWLFDHDTISESNLNRIPVSRRMVGKRKTTAVAQLIKQVRPDCIVMEMDRFIPEIVNEVGLGVEEGLDWVICTTDTWASRRMVHRWAEDHAVKYVEAAAEGEVGSATGEPPEWATPAESTPGYASVPVWVGPCVFAAGIAVAHVLHDLSLLDRCYRIGWEEEEFKVYDSASAEVGSSVGTVEEGPTGQGSEE